MEEKTNTNAESTLRAVPATTYVVLKASASASGSWAHIGPDTVRANSAADAIRKTLATRPDDAAGRFVAVPARSWKPVTVRAETQTVLRLEDATT